MEDLLVSKFGGSSITSYEDVMHIKDILDSDPRRRLIVNSASGKNKNVENDEKVTDMLIYAFNTGDETTIKKIGQKINSLNPEAERPEEHKKNLEKILSENLDNGKKLDKIKSYGEDACARKIAPLLDAEYISPRELIKVTPEFGKAKVLDSTYGIIRQNLGRKLEENPKKRFVVPGFFGFTEEQEAATFDRGGSDLTASIIASALGASIYENFTDSPVYDANPSIVENANKINELTFGEMRDLSYSGFNILQDEAITPVQKARVPVHIRSTERYPEEGTYILSERMSNIQHPIAGVAYGKGFCAFNLSKPGMNNMENILSRIVSGFSDEKISIEHCTTNIDRVSIILKKEQLESGINGSGISANYMVDKMYKTLGDNSEVDFRDNLGCMAVTGKDIKNKKGLRGKIQYEIGSLGIGLEFTSQVSGGMCAIYGMREEDGPNAVKLVHNKYLKKQ